MLVEKSIVSGNSQRIMVQMTWTHPAFVFYHILYSGFDIHPRLLTISCEFRLFFIRFNTVVAHFVIEIGERNEAFDAIEQSLTVDSPMPGKTVEPLDFGLNSVAVRHFEIYCVMPKTITSCQIWASEVISSVISGSRYCLNRTQYRKYYRFYHSPCWIDQMLSMKAPNTHMQARQMERLNFAVLPSGQTTFSVLQAQAFNRPSVVA